MNIDGQRAAPSRSGVSGRFAVVAARFNATIVERLLDGAVHALTEHGIARDAIEIVRVPGAFELPYAAREVADRSDIVAVIALGAVIRGETPHFDVVVNAASQGLMQASLLTRTPVTLGLITANTAEQAHARALPNDPNNKGIEAALAALELAAFRQSFR